MLSLMFSSYFDVAVMLALPLPTAVTSPLVLTVATSSLSVLHVISLLLASAGVTVAVS